MAQSVIRVNGLKETLKTLSQLDRTVAGTIMTKALGIGARKVRDKARQKNFAFTDRTGRLRRSIKLKLGRKKSDERNFTLTAAEGVAFYGRFLYTNANNPFLHRAYDASQREFFDAAVTSVSQQLFQATRR